VHEHGVGVQRTRPAPYADQGRSTRPVRRPRRSPVKTASPMTRSSTVECTRSPRPTFRKQSEPSATLPTRSRRRAVPWSSWTQPS